MIGFNKLLCSRAQPENLEESIRIQHEAVSEADIIIVWDQSLSSGWEGWCKQVVVTMETIYIHASINVILHEKYITD